MRSMLGQFWKRNQSIERLLREACLDSSEKETNQLRGYYEKHVWTVPEKKPINSEDTLRKTNASGGFAGSIIHVHKPRARSNTTQVRVSVAIEEPIHFV